MAQRLKFTPRRRDRILALLAAGNSLASTCAEVGIVRDTLFRWRRGRPDFDEAVKAAIEHGIDSQFDLAKQALTNHLQQVCDGEVPYDHAAVKMALMRRDRAYGTTYAQQQVEHQGEVHHVLDKALEELDAKRT